MSAAPTFWKSKENGFAPTNSFLRLAREFLGIYLLTETSDISMAVWYATPKVDAQMLFMSAMC